MRFKVLSALIFLGFLVSPASAQSSNVSQDLDAGLVSASNPLYGFEVAVDSFGSSIGIVDEGDIAVERANEMALAERNDNSEAVANARSRFSEVAEDAGNESLNSAESVLEGVVENTPDEADQGLSIALDNLKDREVGDGSESAGNDMREGSEGAGDSEGSGGVSSSSDGSGGYSSGSGGQSYGNGY